MHCPSLKFYVYHGPNRLRDETQLSGYHVVITTYTLLSQVVVFRAVAARVLIARAGVQWIGGRG